MYDFYRRMKSDSLNLQGVLEVFEIPILPEDIHRRASLDEIKLQIKEILEESAEGDNDPEFISDTNEVIARIEASSTLDEAFRGLQLLAWDLWDAARTIGQVTFPEVTFKAPKSPTKGPLWNRLNQEDNFQTAIWLILLEDTKMITDPSCFRGFST